MSRRLAGTAVAAGPEWSQEHFAERAKQADPSADLLRAVLRREAEVPPLPTTAQRP